MNPNTFAGICFWVMAAFFLWKDEGINEGWLCAAIVAFIIGIPFFWCAIGGIRP